MASAAVAPAFLARSISEVRRSSAASIVSMAVRYLIHRLRSKAVLSDGPAFVLPAFVLNARQRRKAASTEGEQTRPPDQKAVITVGAEHHQAARRVRGGQRPRLPAKVQQGRSQQPDFLNARRVKARQHQ